MIVSRGPVVPRLRGPMLPVVVGLAACKGLGAGAWSAGAPDGSDHRLILLAIYAGSYAVAFAAWPILGWVAARRPAFGEPRLRNWLLFWGAFGAAAVLGTLLNVAWHSAAVGPVAPFLGWIYEPFASAIGCVLLAEIDAAAVLRARKREESAWLLVADILASRETLRTLEEHKRRHLHEQLQQRIGASIAAIATDIGKLADLDDPRGALVGMRKRIDQLRDDEVRTASHLLHPRIARLGLIPAIKAHIRHWCGHIAVAITVDPAAAEADAPGSGTLTPERRLAAYCLFEAALTRAWTCYGANSASIALRCWPEGNFRLEVSHAATDFQRIASGDESALELAGVRIQNS